MMKKEKKKMPSQWIQFHNHQDSFTMMFRNGKLNLPSISKKENTLKDNLAELKN